MATSVKATKKEKKKPVRVKTSLNNPYDIKWKPLEKGNARFILKTVTEKLSSLDLRKRHVKVFRKWRSKEKAKKRNSDSVDTAEPTQESNNLGGSDSVDNVEPTQESNILGGTDSVNNIEPTQESKILGCTDSVDNIEPTQESKILGCTDSVDKVEPTQEPKNLGGSNFVDSVEPTQESKNQGWTDKRLRKELAIGINEVTKCLEKNELGLVLVCDSVKPAHMTSHLISLSQTRSIPACQVPSLSASLAGPLGLTSVLALGFKRQSGAFADTIAALTPKVPLFDVSWLSTETSEPERRRKRKLEDSLVVKDPVNLLQPLKVKKIVPNPSKTRKLKTKKAKK
ncbi:ribonuclease P protein subunit p38 [Tachysurus vachellii]|uniref:ribonuclease P protein subunit p38 n=1 Tax=Tachysurus vachellii TaxID=175792 RepID=UPI00296AC373|nr:ribonuclease P protein subunit p38 [Tachysurus vachellii]